MESGIAVDDVTKKIKTAITNKLIELGSYVDEELPDYIMVMVANKKSHAQMTNDLNLFLGSNTRNFTTWLHGVLETVQGEPEEKKKEKKRKSPPLQPQEPIANKDKWKVIEIEKPTSTTKPKSIAPEVRSEDKTLEKEAKSKSPLRKEDKSKTMEKEVKHKNLEKEIKHKNLVKEVKSKSPEKDIVTSTDTREETDDVISFRTETDDVLTKELQQEDEKELSPPKIAKSKKTISDRLRSGSRSRSKSPETLNRRVPISFPKRDSAKAAIKIRPMLQRKGLSSTVSSVIRKPARVRGLHNSEEDEEYDPCKPAVGSVASVVRVTERRSSIPPQLQANKLLLFKAIEDANKSLSKKPSVRGSARVAPYKPTPIEPIPAAKMTTPPPQEVKAVQTNEKELMVDDVLKETEPEIPTEMVQIVSPMKKPSPTKRRIETLVTHPVIQDVLDENLLKASQTVIVSPNKGVKRKIEDEIPVEEVLIETVLPVPEPPSHTRFVVTLDGVNPTSLFKKPKSELVEAIPTSTKRIFTPVTPPEIVEEEMYDNDLELIEKYDPDEITMSLEEEDEEDDRMIMDYDDHSFEESEILEKKNVRCQYWPACSRGDSCAYIHPSKPCKNFPSCNFGSKCINIHPNCKFDSQCTRSDCPFTHASKRNAVNSAPQQIHVKKPKFLAPVVKPTVTTLCKFFPHCKNASCPFIHPKLCRYGSFCKTTNCPFTHPKTPSVEKLKWVSAETKTEKIK